MLIKMTFIYITQQGNSYDWRIRENFDEYIQDLELGESVGAKLIKSFDVSEESSGNIILVCEDFVRGRISSLEGLEKEIAKHQHILIK